MRLSERKRLIQTLPSSALMKVLVPSWSVRAAGIAHGVLRLAGTCSRHTTLQSMLQSTKSIREALCDHQPKRCPRC